MATFGQACLILALVTSIGTILFRAPGTTKTQHSVATICFYSLCGFLTLAEVALLVAFLGHNFQIEYVALYSDLSLSWPYLVSGTWAGDSGSLLLWAWLTSVFGVVATRGRSSDTVFSLAQFILGVVIAVLVALLVFANSPFQELDFLPGNGIGLNPLLQHPAMVIHPPLILASYASLALSFAFALASLVSHKVNHSSWLHLCRQWGLISWVLLGAGNLLGAWWSYAELGWGGYWAWDPVENGGLMPWLTTTAFLHSASALQREGRFKLWTLVSIFLSFTLVTFAALITRTNILSSVHTFGESPSGFYLLGLLILVLLGSVVPLVLYRKELREDKVGGSTLQEDILLISNILFLAATLVILAGTLLPIISQPFTGQSAAVGQEFFTTTTVPLFLGLVLVTGVCILAYGKRHNPTPRTYLWPTTAGLAALILLPIFGFTEWYVLVTAFIGAFTLIAIIVQRIGLDKGTPGRTRPTGVQGKINRCRVYLIHLAIVLIALGVTGSSVYSSSYQETLAPGSSMNAGGYILTYQGLKPQGSEATMVIEAAIDTYLGDEFITTMKPQVQFHPTYGAIAEVAIRSTPAEDLYVILGGWDQDMNATIEVRLNPLVMWLWVGGGVLILGGVLALWPVRFKPNLEDKEGN